MSPRGSPCKADGVLEQPQVLAALLPWGLGCYLLLSNPEQHLHPCFWKQVGQNTQQRLILTAPTLQPDRQEEAMEI